VVASFDTLLQGNCSQIYEEFNEMSALDNQLRLYEERKVYQGAYTEAKIIYQTTLEQQKVLQDKCYCKTKATMERTWIELNDPDTKLLHEKLFKGSTHLLNLDLVKPTLQGDISRYEACDSSGTTDNALPTDETPPTEGTGS